MMYVDVKECERKTFEEMELTRGLESYDAKQIVIVPQGYLHDSGYMCMSFVLLDELDNVIAKVGGGCDSVNILDRTNNEWMGDVSFDMLPCGLIRIFSHKGNIHIDSPYLSTCIFDSGGDE